MNDEFVLEEWIAGFFTGEGYVAVRIDNRNKYSLNYLPRPLVEISNFSKSEMAGFVDAEGTIGANVSKHSKRYGIGYRIDSVFQVTQTGFGSSEEINRIINYCDNRNIRWSITEIDDGDDRHENGWKITIRHRKSLKLFLSGIRPMLSRTKGVQVDILLEQIVPRLQRGVHTKKIGFLEVMSWRDLMNSMKGGSRGEYNLEYFEDLWDMKLPEEKKPNITHEVPEFNPTEDVNSIKDW